MISSIARWRWPLFNVPPLVNQPLPHMVRQNTIPSYADRGSITPNHEVMNGPHLILENYDLGSPSMPASVTTYNGVLAEVVQ